MGLDFQSNLGTLRVAPRLRISTSTTDDAQLGIPVAFSDFNGRMWAVCGTVVFHQADEINEVWTQDASGNTPSNCNSASDLELFDGRIWLTTADTLWSKAAAAGDWTSRDTINASNSHAMVYFANVPGGRLYYLGDSDEIWSIDANDVVADSGDYFLQLPDTEILCLASAGESIWIGASQLNANVLTNRDALVFQWDGISAQVTDSFLIKGAAKVMAITVMNDVPYVMDDRGILSKFTGYAFEEVGRLPFTTTLPETDYMCKNGMIVTQNSTILVVVDNQNIDSGETIYENIPSGVWEWSEQFGFTHKYAFSYNTNAAPSTITDWGQNRISVAGAIFDASTVEQDETGANGQYLVGATYFTNVSSTSSAIFFDDTTNTIQKKGYVVTTWIQAEEVQDKWERAYVSYRRFLDPTDSIIPKFRINEEEPTYANITWVNTTSFTTTTNVTAYGPETSNGFNGTQGGEVEFIQGVGSGLCAHILSVVNNAGTYTVTIDETATGATTTTGKARFQKWIKLNPKDAQNQINSFSRYGIGQSNVRIQFKLCFTFKGNDEFFRLGVNSNPDVKIDS